MRVAGVSDAVGIRALLVHALDEAATEFFRYFGFVPSPLDDETLFVTLGEIRASLERAGS